MRVRKERKWKRHHCIEVELETDSRGVEEFMDCMQESWNIGVNPEVSLKITDRCGDTLTIVCREVRP